MRLRQYFPNYGFGILAERSSI